jgi:Fe-S cluster assembly scaffold protein SufB
MVFNEGDNIEIVIPVDQDVETVELKKDACGRIFISGSRRLRLDVILSGENAVLEINGTFAGNADEEQNIILNIVQDAPHTSCNVRFRTAVDGASVSRFDGLIRMTERAIDSYAHLSYRSMLLSKQSRAMPIPRLEILTKQVASASHEASVGNIDAQQLFYLQSRGLSREEAGKLIIDGFLK